MSVQDLKYYDGDTKPDISGDSSASGLGDITGFTITIDIDKPDGLKTLTAAIDDGPNGLFSFTLDSAVNDTVGSFDATLKIVDTGAGIRSYSKFKWIVQTVAE